MRQRRRLLVVVDVVDQYRDGRSSSAAKKAEAPRRAGAGAGVAVGVVVAVVGLAVIVARGEGALFPIVGGMLAFTVAASLLDPRPKGLFRSTR